MNICYKSSTSDAALDKSRDLIAISIVLSCSMLNFILALLNNNIASVSSGVVIAAQSILTVAAVGFALWRGIRVRREFMLGICLWLFLLVASSIYRHQIGPAILAGDFNGKVVYDLLLIPIFIALGSTLRGFPARYLHIGYLIAFLVGMAEIGVPEQFAGTVNPLSYYVNTRGWVAQQVQDDATAEAGFYIGADRPGGSAISGSATGHRAGSIFLEPLSLGYFACVLAIGYMQLYRDSLPRMALAAIACAVLALMADTRVALMLVGAMLVLSLASKNASSRWSLLIPPLVLLVWLSVYYFSIIDETENQGDVGLRLSWTFEVLRSSELVLWFLGGLDLTHANDSAMIAITNSVGVIGTLAFLYTCSGLLSARVNCPIVANSALLYLTTTAMFGGAFLSVKTAALLGLLIGAAGTGALNAVGRRPA